MGPIRCPEALVNNYHATPRNIPEERRSHQHRGGSLKSWLIIFLFIFITMLHNKPQGCGVSVASAAGPFTTKKK
jgi:hypothetical protein